MKNYQIKSIIQKINYIIKTKLNISIEDRVVNPINKSKLENLIVFKNKNGEDYFKYYVEFKKN